LIVDYEDPASGSDPETARLQPYEVAPTLRRARRRRRPRGLLRFVLATAALLVTFALSLVAIGFAYLGRGPISLDSLRPAIADSLQSRLRPGYHVALGPTAVSHGAYGLGIGFTGLVIRDPQGRVALSAPGGRIGLDAFALMRADVKVRRLELDGLQLALQVGANGELSLAAGAAEDNAAPISLGASPASPGATNLGALVAALAEAVAGADQPLDHVAIVDGALTVRNEAHGPPAVYDEFKLAFDRSGDAAKVALSAHGPAGRFSLEAEAQAGAKRKLSVEARDLAAEDFSRLDPHPAAFTFDPPISFKMSAESSPSGSLTALDGAFTLGAGKFVSNDPGVPPIGIDEASGKVSLDAEGRYAIDKLEVLAGATHVRLTGALAPPTPNDALWRARLHSDDAVFAGAGPDDVSAVLDNIDLDAHTDATASTLDVDKLSFRGPHVNGSLAAEVRRTADGPALKLDVTGDGAILEALRLWPTFLNPDARKWCVENIKGGELASGSIKVDWDAAAFAAVLTKRAPPAESVDGRFALHDGSVDLLPGLPTTTSLEASGTITGRVFQASAKRGVMELGGGRRLNGTDLFFIIPNTAPAPRNPANGGGHIVGTADSLADLLTRDSLKRYVGVALDPSAIKGQFQGDLKLDLTLGKGVQPEEQKFRATGALSSLSVDKFLGDTKLEQASVDFAADRTQIKMTGNGLVFGSSAKLEVSKVGQEIGNLVITGVLDEAARARLGFGAGPRVKGPILLKLRAPLDKSGADVDVDLAKASVESLGGPAWKPVGRPGRATFQLKATPEGVQVNNLVIDAGSLYGRGAAMFGNTGDLKSIKLAPFRMSGSDDLKLDVEGGATPKLTIRGASLDARGFVKALTGGGGERDAHDLDVDIKVASASGYNKEAIANFELSGARRAGAFTGVEARGRLGQSAFFAHSGEAGVINVKAEDAGALARFLDLYSKLEGGSIDLKVQNTAEGARGSATIKHFMIRDEPSLKQLEQAAPPPQNATRGTNPSFSADPSPPVRFDKLTANFTHTGGRLDIHDGVVANAIFGLTTQGYIDFGKDKVDINGVYVPLYQFNNALGQIPLLGTLLAGGQNEGVFAINYRVTGPASKPTLNVNPLSGMTPGILRKMFGAFDGTTPSSLPEDSPASSYAPAPSSR